MSGAHKRELVKWTALHDNGWVTHARENLGGTYSAWAAPEGVHSSPDSVEDGPDNAKAAAEYALRTKSGHAECSPQCSGWEWHLYAFDESNGADR